MKTIYVAIPSMYDTELIATVLDCFNSADNPERVVVGVSLMDDNDTLCKVFLRELAQYSEQIRFQFNRVTYRNALSLISVGKGRKFAHSMYRGEDYLLQCDAHTFFSSGWDSKLIALHEEASTVTDKKVVLTGYAGRYRYIDGIRQLIPNEDTLRYPFYVKNNKLGTLIPAWEDQPLREYAPELADKKFLPCVKFNANFAFGDKEFANNSGLYENAVFFEEEPFQSVNLLANGFALVFPNLDEPATIGHLYCTSEDLAREQFDGFRRTGYSYLSIKQAKMQELRGMNNWINTAHNPAMWSAITNYETYAKCSLRFGVIREWYVPDHY
jgi:Glycosyltransferase (GlcNAc)